jgi:hypothetical protein
MRKPLAFLLSLVTLVGGHCFNGRWDRVVLFSALALIWVTHLWFGTGWWLGRGDIDTAVAMSAGDLRFILMMAGVAALLVVSAMVAGRDAIHKPPSGRYTLSGLVGGAALSLLAAAGVMNLIGAASQGSGATTADTAVQPVRDADEFWHWASYGGRYEWDGKGVNEGRARIVGQVLEEGEPAAGVQLRAYFNGGYETENAVSGEDGRFVFDLEPGRWQLNAIHTLRWHGRPDGRFVVLTGQEPPLSLPYRSQPPGPGLELEARADQAEPQLSLHIARAIDMNWPAAAPMYRPAEAGDLASSRIAWQTPLSAAHHVVGIWHIAQEADGRTTYSPTVWLRLDGAQELSLAELPAAEANGTQEYGVEVFAFDDNGRLITQTPGGINSHRFSLEGQRLEEFVQE